MDTFYVVCAALGGTVEALRKLDTVRGVASIMRVEGE